MASSLLHPANGGSTLADGVIGGEDVAMLIRDFFNCLLDDTLEDAREGVLEHPGEQMSWLGTSRAVQECRECMMGRDMSGALTALLENARQDCTQSLDADLPDQWYWFSREAGVEWIAGVVSVILLHQRMPPIVEPTRASALEAARLVGLVDLV